MDDYLWLSRFTSISIFSEEKGNLMEDQTCCLRSKFTYIDRIYDDNILFLFLNVFIFTFLTWITHISKDHLLCLVWANNMVLHKFIFGGCCIRHWHLVLVRFGWTPGGSVVGLKAVVMPFFFFWRVSCRML